MPAHVARSLEDAARQWPDKAVLLSDGGSLDWTTVERRAGAVARRLVDEGLKPGDRVALAIDDPAEVVIALFGALKAGAAVSPLNRRLTQEEQDKIVADLAPAAVVESVPVEGEDFPALDLDENSGAIILYTSGSTGVPKGVLLSHAATCFALESWRGPVMDVRPDDVSLSALPLAHSLGIFGSVLAPLLAGASVAFVPRFSPEDALAAIAKYRATVFPGVATIFRRIVESPAMATADVSSLRYALSGAAPCPWELAEAWKAATGVRIIRGYGMSELFRPISYSAADDRDESEFIGRAVPGVDLRIVDEDGNTQPEGETGEMWIRSPARMTGYLNRPDETAAVFEGDWFKTGDLALVSGEGFVRIVGRMKDIILRGGYTIGAVEVETVLLTHPGIAEAAVIGVPHHDLGEDIAAFIAPRPGVLLNVEDVVAYCKDRMAAYKYPREVRFLDELPKGPTGKVIKTALSL